jgi:hypothetical protein
MSEETVLSRTLPQNFSHVDPGDTRSAEAERKSAPTRARLVVKRMVLGILLEAFLVRDLTLVCVAEWKFHKATKDFVPYRTEAQDQPVSHHNIIDYQRRSDNLSSRGTGRGWAKDAS